MLIRQRAFTLIEILCVVIILAIAALGAIPLFGNGNADVKLSAATRSVMGDLFYAQNLAISSQTPVYILLSRTTDTTDTTDTTGGSYWFLNKNSDGTTYTLVDRPGGYAFGVYLGNVGATVVGGCTRLPDARLTAVKQGATAINSVTVAKISNGSRQWTNVSGALIGFDTFGQPFVGTDAVLTSGKLSATATIELSATSDSNVKYTLSLEPFTGELTAN